MTLATGIKQGVLAPRYQPLLVTGGLYAFTALYYTRRPPLQALGLLVLVATAVFWASAIRREGLSFQGLGGLLRILGPITHTDVGQSSFFALIFLIQRYHCRNTHQGIIAMSTRYFQERAAGASGHSRDSYFDEQFIGHHHGGK